MAHLGGPVSHAGRADGPSESVSEEGLHCQMKVRCKGRKGPTCRFWWPFAHMTPLMESGSWGTWSGTCPLSRRHRARAAAVMSRSRRETAVAVGQRGCSSAAPRCLITAPKWRGAPEPPRTMSP